MYIIHSLKFTIYLHCSRIKIRDVSIVSLCRLIFLKNKQFCNFIIKCPFVSRYLLIICRVLLKFKQNIIIYMYGGN
jgi:hypothetical protein